MTALLAVAASFAFDVPPWQGTMFGADDTVPPPWTVPVAGERSYSCWGRDYALGGKGLVSSIRSAGEELLAAPVSVELNGKCLSFGVSCVTQGVSFAEYDLLSEGGDALVRARLRAEFDGFLWLDVTWGGAGTGEVRSLKVNVPVRRDLVDGFDRCCGTRDDEPLPPGKRWGAPWHVCELHGARERRELDAFKRRLGACAPGLEHFGERWRHNASSSRNGSDHRIARGS